MNPFPTHRFLATPNISNRKTLEDTPIESVLNDLGKQELSRCRERFQTRSPPPKDSLVGKFTHLFLGVWIFNATTKDAKGETIPLLCTSYIDLAEIDITGYGWILTRSGSFYLVQIS